VTIASFSGIDVERVVFDAVTATWELQHSGYDVLDAYWKAPYRQLVNAVDDSSVAGVSLATM